MRNFKVQDTIILALYDFEARETREFLISDGLISFDGKAIYREHKESDTTNNAIDLWLKQGKIVEVTPDATSENPHTFEEGKQYLSEGHGIDYDVRHQGHWGALMTREGWLESVAHKGFIDYDGMGNELDENGNILGVRPSLRSEGKFDDFGDPGWIRPSQADRIRPETKYILWYNR